MKNKIVIFVMIILTAALSANGQQDSMGVETYEYQLDNFNGINGSASFDIEVKKADKFSVLIIADKSLKDELIVKKKGNSLYLGLKPFSFLKVKSPKAIITMPELLSVDLSGASSIIAAGFNSANNFSCDLSGSSSMEIDIIAGNVFIESSGASDIYAVLESESVDIDLSGSSDLEIIGMSLDLTADLTGGASADLRDFEIKNADIEISGNSDIHINMDGILNIDASGSSNMYYTGNVTMGDIDLSGSSTIKEE